MKASRNAAKRRITGGSRLAASRRRACGRVEHKPAATRRQEAGTNSYNDRMDLTVTLNRLRLANPIMVASGTFGYAKEMAGLVDFAKLGGIIPKTVTAAPRAGNAPPRTIETPCGMLNAIG